MKQKTLTIIFGMILLIGLMEIMISGIVSADYIGVITNSSGINISNFIAGTTTTANFSFDYEDIYDADKHYPLIFRINISYAGDEEDCQLENCFVWKGDFKIGGILRRYYLFGLYHKDIELECSEESPLTINHQMGSNIINVPNGIFYCYNTTEGTIETLKKRNKVFLDISSNPALYPATYKITAQMFYANDTIAPIVNILNKSYFDQYFGGEGIKGRKYIGFKAEIIDVNLHTYNAKIITLEKNYSFNKEEKSENIYYFYRDLLDEIPEGYYEILVTATDTEGNIGYDNTTLRIDRTPPEIKLVEPTGTVPENFTIVFNVTDEKSGVNNESVQARLREIVNGTTICPETGGPIGNFSCVTTPWINLTLVDGLFEVYVNTTEYNLTSGEYWLDAKAKDILGNKANWVA